jgi:hypothetical protein
MGTYIYTMRKAKQSLLVDGEPVKANLFDYAYKCGWNWERANSSLVARLEAAGERAFEEYDGGYVIVGDREKGIASLHGCVVYRNVKGPFWVDTGTFPGDVVGFVQVKDGRCRLVTATDWWTPCSPNDRDFRQVVKDGKSVQEVRVHCPLCFNILVPEGETNDCNCCGGSHFITLEEAAALGRVVEALSKAFDATNAALLNMSNEELMA